MTTLPPGRPLAPHQHRDVAESFGIDTERYDRTRPPYPDALIERIVEGSPGRDVLDIGCGTGIEARQFRAAGCRVLGVEPDPRMAAFARRTGVEVEVATIEEWDPAGRTFDAAVAGTAWHWVDPVAGAAKAALALRPAGRLAVFWHAFQLPAEVTEAFVAVYRRVAPDSPFNTQAARQATDAYRPILDKATEGIEETGAFTAPEEWRFRWECTYTRDEWLDQMPTQGPLTRLPPEKVAEVLDGVGSAIDALGGSFTMPYTTIALTATRAAAP
ncbi:class I SAM-dependent methyltransferase [Actinomadura opuntiae]|uniref:class I SAM-dependent methyltransferase n=1 Tax=Actinomadura sp. OS1-43 TaxID=604315 RepID=UPI00255AEE4B|nr:class I SAM-dependent methyltransferase [Actinomadura sp. OS1-43]MDL4820617.1 class I SAM-dependent methyltransferase [Actinomadura sp. OS1-43]